MDLGQRRRCRRPPRASSRISGGAIIAVGASPSLRLRSAPAGQRESNLAANPRPERGQLRDLALRLGRHFEHTFLGRKGFTGWIETFECRATKLPPGAGPARPRRTNRVHRRRRVLDGRLAVSELLVGGWRNRLRGERSPERPVARPARHEERATASAPVHWRRPLHNLRFRPPRRGPGARRPLRRCRGRAAGTHRFLQDVQAPRRSAHAHRGIVVMQDLTPDPRVACPSRSQGGRLPRGRLAGYPGQTEPMGREHGLLRWPPDGRPSTGGYTCAGPTVAHRLNGKRRGSGTADVSFRRGTCPTR